MSVAVERRIKKMKAGIDECLGSESARHAGRRSDAAPDFTHGFGARLVRNILVSNLHNGIIHMSLIMIKLRRPQVPMSQGSNTSVNCAKAFQTFHLGK